MAKRHAVGAATKLVLVGVVLVVAAVLISRFRTPQVPNPFSETHKENPNAVVLAELRDQSRFVAATGKFQTVLDDQQDADYLPDWLKGQRVLFVAEGDVDASVEFGGLADNAIDVAPDGKSVTVHVPQPELSPPRLDPNNTRLVTRDRGVLDRVGDALNGGDPVDQQALYKRAEEKVSDAARQSDLQQRARENTERFLQSLLRGLGYQQVTVVFDPPKPAVP